MVRTFIRKYKDADGRTIRGLIQAETKKGGIKVLTKDELSYLKMIAKSRGIKTTRKLASSKAFRF